MRHPSNFGRCDKFFLIGLGVAMVLGLSAPAVHAASTHSNNKRAAATQTSSVVSSSSGDNWTVETKNGRRTRSKRYFIEFRSRAAADYGHLYVLYGKVNSRDEIVESHISGLFPSGDSANCVNCSVFNWTVGHLIFVPSKTGASDGDLEEKYVTARYRVWMDKAHYKELAAYITKLRKEVPVWNAIIQNCTEYGRTIAMHMGLHVPFWLWMEPKTFVTDLREMNGMKHEQLPLADAPNSLRAKTIAVLDHRPSKSMETSLHGSSTPLPPHRPKIERAMISHPAATKTKPAKSQKKPVAALRHEQAMASTVAAH
jgi:hypothetical protein